MAAKEFRFRPGHLDLGLDAAKPEAHVHFSTQLATMNVLLREYKDYYTTVNAVLNMKGTLLYYMHEYEHAMDVFQSILSKDKTNLNALKNLELLYAELGQQKEADRFERMLIESQNETVEQNEKKPDILKATVLGEQAFAIIYDCHVGVEKSKGYARARDLLKKCLTCSSFKDIDQFQWKYWYAQLVFKDGSSSKTDSEKIEETCLRPIIDSQNKNLSALRVSACTLLGQFQYKKFREPKEKTIETFRKAKQFQREHPKEFMVRYSLFLLGNINETPNVENLKEAKELMDKCTQLTSEKANCTELVDKCTQLTSEEANRTESEDKCTQLTSEEKNCTESVDKCTQLTSEEANRTESVDKCTQPTSEDENRTESVDKCTQLTSEEANHTESVDKCTQLTSEEANHTESVDKCTQLTSEEANRTESVDKCTQFTSEEANRTESVDKCTQLTAEEANHTESVDKCTQFTSEEANRTESVDKCTQLTSKEANRTESVDKCTQLTSEESDSSELNNSVGPSFHRPFQASTDINQEVCWFPHSVKCKVYLRLFQAQCQCFGHDSPEQSQYHCPHVSLLDTAIEEGEMCARMGPTVELFNNIGVAYHQKAKHDTKNSSLLYKKALSHFLRALRHLDGTKHSYVHISHGKCLLDMSEFRPAVECFKRAINSGSKDGMVYHFLLDSYVSLCVELLKLCTTSTPEARDVKCLAGVLNEASHWLRTLSKKNSLETDKRSGMKLISMLNEYMEKIRNYEDKYDALARIVATLFFKCENFNSDTFTDKFLKNQKQFAGKVFCYILQNPHIDRKHLSNIIKLYDDDLLGNNLSVMEQNFADALLDCRGKCSCQECFIVKGKYDNRAIKIFQEMNERFPVFSGRLVEKVKLRDEKFASVLSHHADKEGTVEMEINICSEDHWISEVLAAIHREIRNGKPILSKCLSRIEDHLLEIIDGHFELFHLRHASEKAPRCRQRQFDYDFFVLHNDSEDDRNFVRNDLVPTLEERYGFKGCIPERDLTPGKLIFPEMEECITKSYKTLVILSNEFVKDPKCEFFLSMAFKSKGDSVIHILTEKIQDEDVPVTLKHKVPVEKFDIESLTRALENTLH